MLPSPAWGPGCGGRLSPLPPASEMATGFSPNQHFFFGPELWGTGGLHAFLTAVATAAPSAQGQASSLPQGEQGERTRSSLPQALGAMRLRRSIRSSPASLSGVLRTMEERKVPDAKTFQALLPLMLQADPAERVTVR